MDDELLTRKGERIQTLWGGYGEVRRVRLDDGSTVVVKHVDARDEKPSVGHDRKCRSYDVEKCFYERYAPRCDDTCRVPRLLRARSSDAQWLFVLEDLGRRRAPRLEQCVAWLAAFHARFLGVAPDGLWPNGTYWHLATRAEELAVLDDERLRRQAAILDEKLRCCTHRTLVHGDAKLPNFQIANGVVAAVDFQYVGGGAGVQDLAYLLYEEPGEDDLVERYFALLRLPHVEREWRDLYPIARDDFRRFLLGWEKLR